MAERPCWLRTLAAVQAELARVGECYDQRRVAALACISHQLLGQLTDTFHLDVGATVVGLRLERLQQ